MSSYAEQLRLDSSAVERLADIYYGYAKYHAVNDSKLNREYTASSMLISAALKSIVAPAKAKEVFREAATMYLDLNNSFYKILAICGLYPDLIYSVDQFPNHIDNPNEQFMNYLSRQFYRSSEGYEEFEQDSRMVQLAAQVGRLRIPFRLYVEAFRELTRESNNRFRSFSMILTIAADQIRLLQSDRYHWEELKGNFIPIEPEIIATCICAVQYTNQRLDLYQTLSNQVDPIALVPLLIAKELVPK